MTGPPLRGEWGEECQVIASHSTVSPLSPTQLETLHRMTDKVKNLCRFFFPLQNSVPPIPKDFGLGIQVVKFQEHKKGSIIVAPLIINRTASVDDVLYLIKSNQICLVDIEGAVDSLETVASTRFK